MNFCVLTTINSPTEAISVLHELFSDKLIVVGDTKTPKWEFKNSQFINPSTNEVKNHYARKNIGYLEAMRQGAKMIYDTDDDNIPNKKWKTRTNNVTANVSIDKGWYNIYEVLINSENDTPTWPRGFNLKKINNIKPKFDVEENFMSSIQQGLADGEPDVDAIYRLVIGKHKDWTQERSIYLRSETWCPFNSQTTWWFPKAFPLMYLPAKATFRMTDIWRSFVAQRCLWEINDGVTFHSPAEVFQERNPHDLIKDFADEVDGYIHNEKIVEILSELNLKKGLDSVCDNMYNCYKALVNANLLPFSELNLLQSWIEEYKKIKF